VAVQKDSVKLSDEDTKVDRMNEVIHPAAHKVIRLMTDNCLARVGNVANAPD